MTEYWSVFVTLIVTPFKHMPLVWGIVPLYFALLFSELTSAKKSFRTAIQTGFSFLWAGAQWLYLYRNVAATTPAINMALKGLQPVNRLVDSALWADAVAREEMSGHSTRRGADLWSDGWPRLHLLPQLLPHRLQRHRYPHHRHRPLRRRRLWCHCCRQLPHPRHPRQRPRR